MDRIINEKNKKSLFHSKHLIVVICFVLLIIITLSVAILRWKPKPDPASERIIREAAARQLGKDPNELTDKDFANITELFIYGTAKDFQGQFVYTPPWAIIELSDIRLLNKFTSLELLDLKSIKYPPKNIPKWMKYLAIHSFFNLDKKFAIDLSPLKDLSSLKKLRLNKAQINDITPLKNLRNLEELYIEDCPNVTDDQVKDLQKALPNCKIIR